MDKLTNERIFGISCLIIWVIISIASIFTKLTWMILIAIVYSLWFGGVVSDIGRKGKKEAGLI